MASPRAASTTWLASRVATDAGTAEIKLESKVSTGTDADVTVEVAVTAGSEMTMLDGGVEMAAVLTGPKVGM